MHVQFEDRKLQRSRINIAAYIVVGVFLILLARLWYLQIALGSDLLRAADMNAVRLLRTRAPRGTILDRNNKIMATSRPQFVVMAMPDILEKDPEAQRTLCHILQMTPGEIDAIVKDRMKRLQARPGSPVRIKVDVSLETVARIGENRMSLPGVSVELDQLRSYPDGPAVAHIMGHLGEISQTDLEKAQAEGESYVAGDYVGKSGLEKQYEAQLRGTDGGKEIMVDVTGRMVRILGEKPSMPGNALKLSIDRDLQVAAYKAMGSQTGAVVALDPRTGAVLAMVSAPSYDPNVFVKKLNRADWDKINLNKGRPQQNRAVYNCYPPGSTFKPIMSTAGLIYNQCNPRTTVSCPGVFHLGRGRFKCWKTHGGGVNFNRAMAESCDVWYYNLALRLGIDRMAKVARQFGIGLATGIDLPRESRNDDGRVGLMPDSEWKMAKYRQKWGIGETPSCGIGQGYVLTSPLQMAVATAGVAHDGKIMQPRLVDATLDPDGNLIKRTTPVARRQVEASHEQFDLVRKAMRQTVTSGTGRSCDIADIAVCGKTGSAENPGKPAHAWFVAFAPLDSPTIAVACIIEHGRHGASAAGPVCRAILDVYYGKKKAEEVGSSTANVRGD
ncbi:MAG: penicillin-binding protein 2 [Armatimonadetes bacterium]|nr:penicillin-binding protein 2 [Armatimonadota bacterium]